MEKLTDALEPHPKGLTMRFEVVPGSKKLAVPSGFNPWRRSLEAKLTEEPSRGKANRQLVEAVADLFGIQEDRVEVLSGHKISRKVLLVRGISLEEAASRLSEVQVP
ncbi:MAG TPA: DUF167 domain-containing protein [Methanotrichaceae archaeon]|nr:DUF167 domain-containing protein [Methanotrichaceae archaeon]